jgi:tRNA 2-thiouridine synthesizing protein A
MENKIFNVDARGLSCPQPVMLTRDAIKKMKNGSLQVLVDNATARDNIIRLANNTGWEIQTTEITNSEYKLLLKKL